MASVAKFNLNTAQTQILLPLLERGPGVYTQNMLIEGNSILSSVFIESGDAGATVEVKYYDTTTGQVGTERYDLSDAHPAVSADDAPITDRRTVTKIHNKPIVEATVVSGNVKFGVYITVVSSFASDLDQALQLDGEVADLGTDKGMPMVCYDEDQGKFFFVRCENGTIPVSVSESGDAIHSPSSATTTPAVQQTLQSVITPALKVRKYGTVRVNCRAHGKYIIESDSVIIASGFTGPSTPQDSFRFQPRYSVTAGKDITVKFTAISGTPTVDVESYISGNELDVV